MSAHPHCRLPGIVHPAASDESKPVGAGPRPTTSLRPRGPGKRGEGAGCKDNLPGKRFFSYDRPAAADLPTKGDMPRTQPKAKVRTSTKTAAARAQPDPWFKGRRVHRGRDRQADPFRQSRAVPGPHGVPGTKTAQPRAGSARPGRSTLIKRYESGGSPALSSTIRAGERSVRESDLRRRSGQRGIRAGSDPYQAVPKQDGSPPTCPQDERKNFTMSPLP